MSIQKLGSLLVGLALIAIGLFFSSPLPDIATMLFALVGGFIALIPFGFRLSR